MQGMKNSNSAAPTLGILHALVALFWNGGMLLLKLPGYCIGTSLLACFTDFLVASGVCLGCLHTLRNAQTDRMKTIGQLWREMNVEERDQVLPIF